MIKNKLSMMQKIAASILLLTLGSCFLFSSMFARYTTGQEGTPDGARVSSWRVNGISTGTVSQSFQLKVGNLSPDVNNSAHVWLSEYYVIENASEVAAELSFEIPQFTFYTDVTTVGEEQVYDEKATYATGKYLTTELIQRVISIKYEAVFTNAPTEADWTNATLLTGSSKIALDTKNGAGNKAVAIRASVVWETLSESTLNMPEGISVTAYEGDIIDGLIGLYIQGAKADIRFIATQID